MSTLSDLLAPRVLNAFQSTAPSLDRRVFRIDCELSYEVDGPTEFVFLVHAQNSADQHVRQESLALSSAEPHRVYEDHARGHRFTRLSVDEGAFTLNYRSLVRKTVGGSARRAQETPVAELPDAMLHLLSPTRYCESDLLGSAAQKLFGSMRPGYARVQAISDWIHEHIDYVPGSTDATSTARDVFVQRQGVCRDFAHLGISFCRALNIPARLVVGYAIFETPPSDFHAVFEAWLGGRWVLFDPTQMSPVEDLVRIASGRDAKDVALATLFGPARMVSMNPQITRVDAVAASANGVGDQDQPVRR